MNSETRDDLEIIAQQAGAIISCPTCGNHEVSAGDGEAEDTAYAMATNAWKAGEFGASSREEIMAAMKGVLLDANIDCPDCERERPD